MMTPREINRLVVDYVGTTNDGYLKHFSYSKHDSFYHLYCDLDVDVSAYRSRGLTTKNGFIQILKDAQPRDQAKIIRGAFAFIPPPENPSNDEDQKRLKAYNELLTVASRLEADGHVVVPANITSTETVFEALKDAEVLLKNRGAKNAVDRAHTALHGYLKGACAAKVIIVPSDPSLTTLFKLIREQFPEFKNAVSHDAEVKRLLGSLATALDTLNTIRNRATLAHPNEVLLESEEAMLYINLSRAMLAYVDSKLQKKGT
jgi:HEPN domain-containing protein